MLQYYSMPGVKYIVLPTCHFRILSGKYKSMNLSVRISKQPTIIYIVTFH